MNIKLKIFCFVTLFIYTILLPAVSIGTTLSCKAERAKLTAVVTPEKVIKETGLFHELLDSAVKQIRKDEQYNNFILFVHGMGQHPCHAFDKSLIADMQKDYSAKVIMYHWPSWDGVMGFPDKKARESAKDLKKVLLDLKAYQEKNKDIVKDIKFSLMTHSMGSIVLEELLLNYNGESIPKLFDTIIINASCSSGKKHAFWVEKIQMSENIYITVNLQDPTLGKAELLEEWKYGGSGWSRLGKRLTSKDGVEIELAKNAIYVDIADCGFRHVYYLHRYLSRNSSVKLFFDSVLNGIPAIFDKTHGLKKIEREQIYFLKNN